MQISITTEHLFFGYTLWCIAGVRGYGAQFAVFRCMLLEDKMFRLKFHNEIYRLG